MNQKKNKNKNGGGKQKAAAASQKRQNKKPTPFSDAGAIVGSRLGTMFNAPYLKGVGKWLGSGIGSIFGSGDYTMVGPHPEYNVLMNGAQIPQFQNSSSGNIVCHREYLGDISGTTAFTLNSYPLNPGISKTFPWLSTVAQNYQQFRFHGLIFEFRPLLTDFVVGGAPGVAIMATNYNADAPAYNTKQEMENSEFAVSVKPTLPMLHGVECNPAETVLSKLYVRTGASAVGLDLKFTDLGRMQFATQQNPASTILGELWVSYVVEFFKPILPIDVGGNVNSFRAFRNGYTAAAPLGTVAASSGGDLDVSITTTDIFINGAQPGNYYAVTVEWEGVAALALTYAVATVSGGTFSTYFSGLTLQNLTVPPAGVVSTSGCVQFVLLASVIPSVPLSIKFGGASVFPVNANINIVITPVSSESAV
jgi:hypothetical protein